MKITEQLQNVIKFLSPSATITVNESKLRFCAEFEGGERISVVWGGLAGTRRNRAGEITHVEILCHRGDEIFVPKGGKLNDAGAQMYQSGQEVVLAVIALLSGDEGEELPTLSDISLC